MDGKTISQMANELGVSRQRVYQCIKDSGIDIKNLTQEKLGNSVIYSVESVNAIMSACREQIANGKHGDNVGNSGKDNDKDNDNSNSTRAQLREQVTQLKHELDKANAELARLRDVETELRHTVSSLTETLRIVTLTNNMKMLKAAGVGTSGTSDTNTDTNEGGNGLFARIKSKVAGLWL